MRPPDGGGGDGDGEKGEGENEESRGGEEGGDGGEGEGEGEDGGGQPREGGRLEENEKTEGEANGQQGTCGETAPEMDDKDWPEAEAEAGHHVGESAWAWPGPD